MMHKIVLEPNHHRPILTLKDMCCIKIITGLSNNPHFRKLIFKCYILIKHNSFKLCSRSGKEWEAVLTMANVLVSQTCMPTSLKKRILEFLWPMCYRIILWRSIYAPSINSSILQHFHWTDRGRIDNTRTIKCLIGKRNISVRKRFILACSVCLENEIFEIWRDMSSEDKAYFYSENPNRISPLIHFWLLTLEEPNNVSEEDLDHALTCASEIGLLEAVKHLFAMATATDMIFIPSLCMEVSLNKLRSVDLLEEDEKDIEYFLFSQLTEGQQESTFKFFTDTAVSILLHSTKYELCLNFLEERMKTTSLYDIASALKMIFYTYHLEVVNDEDCRFLFMEFWQKIPSWMRRTPILYYLVTEFLSVLIRDNFPFLLEEQAFLKIAELTSLDFNCNTSDEQVYFHRGKWYLLHFIIAEAITIPLLNMHKRNILYFLKKEQSNKIAWNGVLRFVRKVKRESRPKRIK